MENIIIPKLCEYNNCQKKASYGIKRDTPIRCITHKENMKFVSTICLCGKAQANYNALGQKALYCSKCKTDGMINVKHKLCLYEECKTLPTYNYKGEVKLLYCFDHKLDGMINVKNKKCVYEGCDTIPNYNYEREVKGIYCSTHRLDGMIDVKNKKCVYEGCNTLSTYNYKGEVKTLYCSKHKLDGMIDINHRRCIYEECKAQPTYNYEGKVKTLYCSKHKLDGMIDIKHRTCLNEECKTIPNFNYKGEIKRLYCSTHRLDGMIDVTYNKCLGFINNGVNEECPYDTRGNTKYRNYCTECFKRNFPLDPLTFQIHSKTKEIAVRDFINQHFDGFQHNKKLQTGHCDCTMRRSIDHRKLIGNTLLAIETDENQHKSYDKMDEEIRYDDLYMAHSGKWIYIRFNPDKYIDNKGFIKNPMLNARFENLKNEIEKQIKRIENEENTELVERVYMYYDNYD
jgi:hypothetical protein